jgi:hypothetical protein
MDICASVFSSKISVLGGNLELASIGIVCIFVWQRLITRVTSIGVQDLQEYNSKGVEECKRMGVKECKSRKMQGIRRSKGVPK